MYLLGLKPFMIFFCLFILNEHISYRTPFVLGTSFEPVSWIASRIARARALKADSALWILDENRPIFSRTAYL